MRFIALVLVFLGISIGAPDSGRFAGIWVAHFKGADICTIEINQNDSKIDGVTKSCKVSIDQNGELIDADAPDPSEPPRPFLKAQATGGVLTYEQEDNDGQPMKFEFRLSSEGKADLHILGAPIAIRPIRFERRK